MKRFACLAIAFVAACGDDGSVTTDAKVIDAPAIDTPDIDAPPPPVFSGSFSIVEASVLNPAGAPTPIFGQGLQAGISFSSSAMVPAPILEEIPGAPIGCKVWEYTPAQAAASSIGIDEGPVNVTFTGGTMPATPPAMPACGFSAGAGYACPDMTTAGTGGTIAVVGGGVFSLTVAGTPYTDANSVGRYVRISGAGMAANNGVFPIVGRVANNVIRYANASPAAMAETLPVAATRINIAGVGPIPAAASPDPGFLADDVALTFAHPAAGPNVGTFSLATVAGGIGDDFTLDAASTALLGTVPRTGVAMTFSCAAGSCGAGSASGSLINIVTTDAPVAGLSPFTMPPPVTKRVQIRCAQLGATTITIPAAYSAKLMSAGATRIQATFIRGALLSSTNPPVTGVAGHAIVAFTTP